ncbi:MAG: hypothetical protein AAGM38_01505 [Pseudomonadota bacterium]
MAGAALGVLKTAERLNARFAIGGEGMRQRRFAKRQQVGPNSRSRRLERVLALFAEGDPIRRIHGFWRLPTAQSLVIYAANYKKIR